VQNGALNRFFAAENYLFTETCAVTFFAVGEKRIKLKPGRYRAPFCTFDY